MGKLSKHFDALVGALSPELYRYAMGLCHNPDVAQDLVQETFLRAWRSQQTLRDVKTARAWLYTILRNEHARLYERQRPDIRDPHTLPEVAVRGYDTSTEAFALRLALDELDLQYREPLMLQVIGGVQLQGDSGDALSNPIPYSHACFVRAGCCAPCWKTKRRR